MIRQITRLRIGRPDYEISLRSPDAPKSLDRSIMTALRSAMTRNADPSSWPFASKARIAAWRRLGTKKGRNVTGQILLEGVRLVAEGLASGGTVESLIAADSADGVASVHRVLARAGGWSGPAVRVAPQDFKHLADTSHSAGVAAVIEWRPGRWDEPLSRRPRHLLYCDRISDPGNLGTLIRTAAGLGVEAVLVSPDSVEITNPKTVRATAGAIFRIPIVAEVPVDRFIAFCQEQKFVILVADRGRGRPDTLAAAVQAKGWALVIGGETKGPDPAWGNGDTTWIQIPMRRGVESFNAAVAGAILMDRLCHRGR
jgi:TrmH family RNA methyltransferase